jgi:hypothetical protein
MGMDLLYLSSKVNCIQWGMYIRFLNRGCQQTWTLIKVQLFSQLDNSHMYALSTTDSLLDIFLGPCNSSGAQPCFLNDECVLVNIFSGNSDTTSLAHRPVAPPTLKIRCFGPLTQVPNMPVWRMQESFEVCVNCCLKFGLYDWKATGR